MDFNIIYEDENLLVIDKPAGLVVFPEGQTKDGTVIDDLIKKYPELKQAGEAPRYGIVHRLDKDTSGILLVAKTTEALIFLQKKFINREVEKKYTALAEGQINQPQGPEENGSGTIKTLIARSKSDPRKQKAYTENERHPQSAREAVTHYNVIKKYKNYTLTEVKIETGRRHQIRCHLSYIGHPIAGDKMYGFKNSVAPSGLNRQFLHASYLKIQLPNGRIQEFESELPQDLKTVLDLLEKL